MSAALVALALSAVGGSVHANGRFPRAQRLLEHPSDPSRLFLSATYGLLVTVDRGSNWDHLCERAFAPEVYTPNGIIDADPLLDVTRDGTVLAGMIGPLRASSDCGCSWTPVLTPAEGGYVVDIARSGVNGVVALVQSGAPLGYHLEHSSDGGGTWTRGADLPMRIVAFTLDIAPLDSNQIYVSVRLSPDPDAGATSAVAAILASSDGGLSWDTHPMAAALAADQPYIAAVHPTNAAELFVRTDTWLLDPDGFDTASDALFHSDDSGRSFREVVRKAGKLFGFALSPDAERVVVGFGDLAEPVRLTNSAELGIYAASTSDLSFEQAVHASVTCLAWTTTGLYSCFQDHPELPATFSMGVADGRAIPASLDDFMPLLNVADVRGPPACGAAACLDDWRTGNEENAAACERLNAACEIDPAENVLACAPSSGGSAGSGTGGSSGAATGGASGGGSDGGSGNSSSGSAGSGQGAADTRPERRGGGGPSGSCGCRSIVDARPNTSWSIAALLLFFRHARRSARIGFFDRRVLP